MSEPGIPLTPVQRKIFNFLHRSWLTDKAGERKVYGTKEIAQAVGSTEKAIRTHIYYLRIRLEGTRWRISFFPFRLVKINKKKPQIGALHEVPATGVADD